MKNVQNLFILFVVCSLAISCKKGDQGISGADGADGNANVISYTFGEKTFTGQIEYDLENISRGKMDSSLILVFYNPSSEAETAWYSVPGAGSSNGYQTRYLVYQSALAAANSYKLSVRLYKLDGSNYAFPVTFKKLKVIIASPSTTIANASGMALNLKDYNVVKQRYNLKD